MVILNENIEKINISGYKNTKQRNKIIEILKSAQSPITAEEIYSLIKNESNSLAFSTIYRNMKALVEKNIVTKTIYNDGKARYELARKEHIHHLICLKCNKSVAIENCPMKQIEKDLKKQEDFDVLEHKIEIYGYCKLCRKQQN